MSDREGIEPTTLGTSTNGELRDLDRRVSEAEARKARADREATRRAIAANAASAALTEHWWK